jgi:hypothetical protein
MAVDLAQAIEGAIVGAVKGGILIWKGFKEGRAIKNASRHLDEMLRNPTWPYRNTSQLARILHDTTDDYSATRKILLDINARPNLRTDGSDTWVFEENWQWIPNPDHPGSLMVARNPDNTGKLKDGVKPGKK